MNTSFRISTLLAIGLVVWGIDVPLDGSSAPGIGRSAHAIVGAPLTPVSVAGVARRTTRRTVAVAGTAAVATTAAASSAAQASPPPPRPATPPPAVPVGTVVPALPGDCGPATVNGVSYSYCNGVYYRAGFQGNNVVYVVAQP
jgi:hypothetical protein